MSKFLRCLLLIFFLGSYLCADEYVIDKISYYDFDTRIIKEMNFKYDDKRNIYYLQTSDFLTTAWIEITPDQLVCLRNTVKKSVDWANIAKENSTTVEKELPDSTITTDVIWSSGGEVYKNASWNKLDIHIHFVSVFENPNTVTSILLYAGKVSASNNKYENYEFPGVVMIDEQITDFSEIISENNINNAKDKHKEEKKVQDLFQ